MRRRTLNSEKIRETWRFLSVPEPHHSRSTVSFSEHAVVEGPRSPDSPGYSSGDPIYLYLSILSEYWHHNDKTNCFIWSAARKWNTSDVKMVLLLRVLGLWESQGVEAQIREKQQSLGRRIIKLYYFLFIRWTPCHCHVHDISVRILPEPLVMLLWTLSFCLFAVMLGVSQLSTRDITETSVTLVWTPPPVQYDSYHITFTSQVQTWLILIIWRCNRVSIPRDIIEVESCGHKAHGPCLSVIIRLFWCVLNSYIWSLLLLDVALQPKFKGEK